MVRDFVRRSRRRIPVLVVLNLAKQKIEAILGAIGQGLLRILCSYEYHAGEPGWHCHAACQDVTAVPPGYMRGPWVTRVPGAKRTHSRQDLGIADKTEARQFAFRCYKIEKQGSLL